MITHVIHVSLISDSNHFTYDCQKCQCFGVAKSSITNARNAPNKPQKRDMQISHWYGIKRRRDVSPAAAKVWLGNIVSASQAGPSEPAPPTKATCPKEITPACANLSYQHISTSSTYHQNILRISSEYHQNIIRISSAYHQHIIVQNLAGWPEEITQLHVQIYAKLAMLWTTKAVCTYIHMCTLCRFFHVKIYLLTFG